MSVSAADPSSYYYVRRGDENYYLGLGSHIVRAGMGVRFGRTIR
jgi:hypothetical protein